MAIGHFSEHQKTVTEANVVSKNGKYAARTGQKATEPPCDTCPLRALEPNTVALDMDLLGHAAIRSANDSSEPSDLVLLVTVKSPSS